VRTDASAVAGVRQAFEKLDLTPGGEATYFMTGPEGAMWGAWRVRSVDPPTSLEFINAFPATDGTPTADMPVFTVTVRLTERDGRTRMEIHLQVRVPRGHEDDGEHGHSRRLQRAVGQIDRLLA
jgi:uncharacterized protein YndB with AHSA1/START domain